MSLSNKAMLASLSISKWSARKFDKKATANVETTFNTEARVGNYNKQLLPGASELKAVESAAGALRDYFHENTLPWGSDGTRILPSQNYMTFLAGYNARKQAFESAAGEFYTAYPTLVQHAQRKLGSLANATDYPSLEEVMHKFGVDIVFMPMPDVADFRVAISEDEKQAFVDRMKAVETAAMQDLWKRIHTVTAKAAATLSNRDAIYRDSLIENIRDCCSVLSKLNVTDDPNLETMRREVESLAGSINPDTCRISPFARDAAAVKLDEITKRMGAFMGAN